MPTVLVSLPSGAGVVRREDGTVVVTADTRRTDGFPLSSDDPFHPAKCAVERDRCLIGGRLPEGAVAAEVVDDHGARVPATVAAGAYIALLEQPHDYHEPIVCCRDAEGRPVRRPPAAEYPSESATDVHEPCPACGASDFEECRPFEAWRGGELRPDGTTVPTPIVRCRVCGQEEEEAIVLTAPPVPPGSQPRLTRAEVMARARAMRREHMWDAVAPGLQAQSFPIYVADGWYPMLSGCGSEDDGRLTYVIADHYETEDADPAAGGRSHVRIRTMLDYPQDSGPLEEVRQALRTWVRTAADDTKPGRGASQAASALWIRARHREHSALVLDAAESEQLLTIDGTLASALMLTAPGGRWAAVVVRGELTLVVAGHDVEPGSLRIAPVADPVEAFGPRSVA